MAVLATPTSIPWPSLCAWWHRLLRQTVLRDLSAAVATICRATVSVSPTGVVQVEACDPGAAEAVGGRTQAPVELVARQEARLVAASEVSPGSS